MKTSEPLSPEYISELESLQQQLKNEKNVNSRLETLLHYSQVDAFVKLHPDFSDKILNDYEGQEQYLLLSLVAARQGPLLESMFSRVKKEEKLEFLKFLQKIDSFYDPIGGLIGYHATVLKLLSGQDLHKHCHIFHPVGIDISHSSKQVRESVINGISALKDLAEIYPIGGAGERLGLTDREGKPLPVASLPFCGRSLLEGLIRDLQARENLYFKLFGEQLFTPIVMMTSHEKENDQHIEKICEEKEWFGRPKDLFFRFPQPEAPVMTKEGMWAFTAPLQLLTKPGGHGVLWTLCKQTGAFDWLYRMGRHKVFVRQINNPIAGTDSGILGFIGVGYGNNKAFGFASCPRKVGASEGVVVLLQKKGNQETSYCISNIEYIEFSKRGIEDSPKEPDSPYSIFPANTNILYADISSLEMAEKKIPFPGMLVNMKSEISCLDEEGNLIKTTGGRLECMMQNIADGMADVFDHLTSNRLTRISHIGSSEDGRDIEKSRLRTYVTFYDREKTISVTKKSYAQGEKILETPEGCFYELQKNMHLLFSKHCGMDMPPFSAEREYLAEGPSSLILFHPALGPMWEMIAQKIRKGKLTKGSELSLEIAEVDIENFHLEGSCLIEADQILGHREYGTIIYSEFTGKCELKNVSIINQGINRTKENHYWKNEIYRKECFSLHLHGNAEFYAENITFQGNHAIEVPAGHRMTAREFAGSIRYDLDPIDRSSWSWKYTIGDQKQIQLKKKENSI